MPAAIVLPRPKVEWAQAACTPEKLAASGLNIPRDAFFQDEWSHLVKKICAQCPINYDCGLYALRGDEYGIWGGTTRDTRLLALKPTRRVRCIECKQLNPRNRGGIQICGACGLSWKTQRNAKGDDD